MNMGKTVVYIYAMTNDTGFAPCVDNSWFTLACCKGGIKGGMRKKAAQDFKNGDTVFLLGLCGKSLKQSEDMLYKPIYLAQVDEAISMKEYYGPKNRSSGRKDDVYYLENGELKAKDNNLHSEEDKKKDIGGEHVLCAKRFTYWGNKCGISGEEIERAFSETFKRIRDRKTFRNYMVDRDFSEFIPESKKWVWFHEGCNYIGKQPMNETCFIDESANDETEELFCGNRVKSLNAKTVKSGES